MLRRIVLLLLGEQESRMKGRGRGRYRMSIPLYIRLDVCHMRADWCLQLMHRGGDVRDFVLVIMHSCSCLYSFINRSRVRFRSSFLGSTVSICILLNAPSPSLCPFPLVPWLAYSSLCRFLCSAFQLRSCRNPCMCGIDFPLMASSSFIDRVID